MSRTSILLAALLWSAAASAVPLGIAYPPSGPWWVATNGNDSTGDGSQAHPWLTIAHARDAIRNGNLNATQRADIVINVRAGTYSLATSGPIVLGHADSGFNGHLVRYVSYDRSGTDCAAHINGGVTVSGWVLDSGSTYKASVAAAPWTVYENGIRSRMARNPNWSLTVGYPNNDGPYFTAQSTADSLTSLAYSSGDFDPTSYPLADFNIRILPGGIIRWLSDHHGVSGVNTGTHVITLAENAKFNPYYAAIGGGASYFVEGPKALLDVGGEFYVDRSGLILYYIARDGPIASQTVTVPQQAELLQVFGASGQPQDLVSNVTFDGFCFENTDFFGRFYQSGYPYDFITTVVQSPVPQPHTIDPLYDYFATQPAFRVGAVHLRNATAVTITNAHFSDIGTRAVFMEGYARGDTVSHSLIEHVGDSGIKLDGPYPGEQTSTVSVGGDTVYDVKIDSVGEFGVGASGIDLAQSDNNSITYSTLMNGPRKGVWIYADEPIATSLVYACNNTVDHVKMSHFSQDSCDSGAYAVTALSSIRNSPPYTCPNTLSQTIIDATGFPGISCNNSLVPTGILNDDQSAGTAYTNVQVTNTVSPGAPYRNNTGGAGTVVLTNTSFNVDGTANGSFNAGAMDTANIGTLGSCSSTAPPCFPY